MQELFSAEYRWLWIIVMAIALFFPVRQFIWASAVRRHIRKAGTEKVTEQEQIRLKKRAGFTAILMSSLFSLFYMSYLFQK